MPLQHKGEERAHSSTRSSISRPFCKPVPSETSWERVGAVDDEALGPVELDLALPPSLCFHQWTQAGSYLCRWTLSSCQHHPQHDALLRQYGHPRQFNAFPDSNISGLQCSPCPSGQGF